MGWGRGGGGCGKKGGRGLVGEADCTALPLPLRGGTTTLTYLIRWEVYLHRAVRIIADERLWRVRLFPHLM